MFTTTAVVLTIGIARFVEGHTVRLPDNEIRTAKLVASGSGNPTARRY